MRISVCCLCSYDSLPVLISIAWVRFNGFLKPHFKTLSRNLVDEIKHSTKVLVLSVRDAGDVAGTCIPCFIWVGSHEETRMPGADVLNLTKRSPQVWSWTSWHWWQLSLAPWEQDLGLREPDFHGSWQEGSSTGLQVYALGLTAWFSGLFSLQGAP